MLRVALVEDEPLARRGFAESVRESSDIELVREVADIGDILCLTTEDVDVVILDFRLANSSIDGAEAVEALVRAGFKVLVHSAQDLEYPVLESMEAGASGYLTKETEPPEIFRAIREVAKGNAYISATVAGFLLKSNKSRLTKRETEILRLIASGETSRRTAQMLHIEESTVNGALDKIRDKTQARNRAQLTRVAYEKGIFRRR